MAPPPPPQGGPMLPPPSTSAANGHRRRSRSLSRVDPSRLSASEPAWDDCVGRPMRPPPPTRVPSLSPGSEERPPPSHQPLTTTTTTTTTTTSSRRSKSKNSSHGKRQSDGRRGEPPREEETQPGRRDPNRIDRRNSSSGRHSDRGRESSLREKKSRRRRSVSKHMETKDGRRQGGHKSRARSCSKGAENGRRGDGDLSRSSDRVLEALSYRRNADFKGPVHQDTNLNIGRRDFSSSENAGMSLHRDDPIFGGGHAHTGSDDCRRSPVHEPEVNPRKDPRNDPRLRHVGMSRHDSSTANAVDKLIAEAMRLHDLNSPANAPTGRGGEDDGRRHRSRSKTRPLPSRQDKTSDKNAAVGGGVDRVLSSISRLRARSRSRSKSRDPRTTAAESSTESMSAATPWSAPPRLRTPATALVPASGPQRPRTPPPPPPPRRHTCPDPTFGGSAAPPSRPKSNVGARSRSQERRGGGSPRAVGGVPPPPLRDEDRRLSLLSFPVVDERDSPPRKLTPPPPPPPRRGSGWAASQPPPQQDGRSRSPYDRGGGMPRSASAVTLPTMMDDRNDNMDNPTQLRRRGSHTNLGNAPGNAWAFPSWMDDVNQSDNLPPNAANQSQIQHWGSHTNFMDITVPTAGGGRAVSEALPSNATNQPQLLRRSGSRQRTTRTAPVTNMTYTDPYGDTGLYSGEVNEFSLPHGRGKMKYDNGIFFEGNWIDGRKDEARGESAAQGNDTRERMLRGFTSWKGTKEKEGEGGKSGGRFVYGMEWADRAGRTGKYTGKVDANDEPAGRGVMRYEFGLVAEGDWKGGVLLGGDGAAGVAAAPQMGGGMSVAPGMSVGGAATVVSGLGTMAGAATLAAGYAPHFAAPYYNPASAMIAGAGFPSVGWPGQPAPMGYPTGAVGANNVPTNIMAGPKQQ